MDSGYTDAGRPALKNHFYQTTDELEIEKKARTKWVKPRVEAIVAESPIELLGLASMLECRVKDWKAANHETDNFLKRI